MTARDLDATVRRLVYLDFNASTPLDRSVAAAMEPLLRTAYGNPSSTHWAGRAARAVMDEARRQVADLLGASTREIVFTGGGTEANNQALKGVVFAAGVGSAHVVTTQVEHPAVLEPCRFLERLGAAVTRVPVDATGLVDPADIERALTSQTVLVSVMHANNEVGTIQPIAEIAGILRSHEALFHVDAAQSVGKIDVDVHRLGVDLLSVAGHKLYAPKGVGALYVRHGVRLEPLLHGAGHEGGRRAGTENVLLMAGLGAAARLARQDPCGERIRELTAYFWDRLRRRYGDRVHLNGHPVDRLPNTLNVSFEGWKAYDLLPQLTGIAASAGSACHAGQESLSPVLAAMGVSPARGLGAIRFSLGRTTTQDELDYVVERLEQIVRS